MTDDQKDKKATYELSVNLQVLKHLGIGLYSNLPSVVSEMVANAYDADATTVDITIDKNSVVIKDNGLGMDVDDANARFLTVGYDKRGAESKDEKKELKTAKFGRLPMGRKGIGKLSTFAISNEVSVESIKTCFDRNEKDEIVNERECGRAAFEMRVKDIETAAKAGEPYNPKDGDISKIDFNDGTRISLRDLKRKKGINADFVRRNLARRFAVFGADFKVSINTKEVTINDRQYWDKLQFVWGLGQNDEFGKAKKGKNVKNDDAIANSTGTKELLAAVVDGPDGPENVSGWIGTVALPQDLKDDNLDNNGIVVMARGKLVHENLLPFARTGMVFSEYVVGEIEADWLDTDDEDDIATSDRQNLKEDDPRFTALQKYLKDRLVEISTTWDKWRKAVGTKEAIKRHPALSEWLDSLTSDNKKRAAKLIAVIEGMPISDLNSKKELFKHGIMAFETLALRGNLDALGKLSTIGVEEFREVLNAMSELDAAHYYQIAKNRLTVLQEFERLVTDKEKEKLVQEKIFENTWLLDPSWERPTADAKMEKRFIDSLKAKKVGIDKNVALSRYDIKYRSVSNKDLVIELKRGGRKIKISEIIEQVQKYGEILEALALEAKESPNYEIVVIVDGSKNKYSQKEDEALRPFHARVMTFQQLIKNAVSSYKEHLAAQKKIARIEAILDKL